MRKSLECRLVDVHAKNCFKEERLVSPDAVVRAWFKEVWDEGNEDAIDRLLAPDAVAHGLGPDEIRGPDAFKPYVRTMRAALGDLEVEVVQTLTEGDRVAAHCHVVARHVGALFGAAATQRPVDFWGITIVRVRDGQIVEGWNCFDFLQMYQQMGWVRDPPLPQ
jgi:predicted ester cyclase